jgi:hypothetical protein
MCRERLCAIFLVSALIACNLGAQSEIEKFGRPYTDKLGDTTATLTYWPTETGTDLIFKANDPGNALPSLEVQCELLDRLLGRVLSDHPTERRFEVALGSMQESFIQPLQRFLATSPDWDSLHGRPRQQRQLSEFLTEAINKSGILGPVVKTFGHHGLTLSIYGMSRIEIRRISSMNGARLPSYIWKMNFVAEKQ